MKNLTQNQTIHANINGKIYQAKVKRIFADCIGIILPFDSFMGVPTTIGTSSELVRLTTIFDHQIVKTF